MVTFGAGGNAIRAWLCVRACADATISLQPAPAFAAQPKQEPKKKKGGAAADAPKPAKPAGKAKHPLDLLPKTSMNLDEWKRTYSNLETRGAARTLISPPAGSGYGSHCAAARERARAHGEWTLWGWAGGQRPATSPRMHVKGIWTEHRPSTRTDSAPVFGAKSLRIWTNRCTFAALRLAVTSVTLGAAPHLCCAVTPTHHLRGTVS